MNRDFGVQISIDILVNNARLGIFGEELAHLSKLFGRDMRQRG